jgi:hypothetical protein
MYPFSVGTILLGSSAVTPPALLELVVAPPELVAPAELVVVPPAVVAPPELVAPPVLAVVPPAVVAPPELVAPPVLAVVPPAVVAPPDVVVPPAVVTPPALVVPPVLVVPPAVVTPPEVVPPTGEVTPPALVVPPGLPPVSVAPPVFWTIAPPVSWTVAPPVSCTVAPPTLVAPPAPDVPATLVLPAGDDWPATEVVPGDPPPEEQDAATSAKLATQRVFKVNRFIGCLLGNIVRASPGRNPCDAVSLAVVARCNSALNFRSAKNYTASPASIGRLFIHLGVAAERASLWALQR